MTVGRRGIHLLSSVSLLTLNMLNCFKDSHFESHLGFGMTQADELNSGTTLFVLDSHTCLLRLWPCVAMTSAGYKSNYNMTVWILAGNYISVTIAAGLIRLHMPGVKKSRV